MNPGEEKAEVSLSSEFFKKLNQQIVQKDNLIKLLQLQIKNLKSQVEEGGDQAKKGDLSKALEAKEAEIKRIESELSAQRNQLANLAREKDEQIQTLNRIIEEQKNQTPPVVEAHDDPRVPELETAVAKLQQELESERQQRAQLEGLQPELEKERQLRISLESSKSAGDKDKGKVAAMEAEIAGLKQELEQQKTQISQEWSNLQSELEQQKAENAQLVIYKEKIPQLEAQLALVPKATESSPEILNRVSELEQDIVTLKNLLVEKDEQIASLSSGAAQPVVSGEPDPALLNELARTKAELDQYKSQAAGSESQLQRMSELEAQLARLQVEAQQARELQEKLTRLESESSNYSEAALKLTAIEEEKSKLNSQADSLKLQNERLTAEIATLKKTAEESMQRISQRDHEISELRSNVEGLRTRSQADAASKTEIEQLTNQVADQLLAIQKFEEVMRANQEKLRAKDDEIAALRTRLIENDTGTRPVQINSGSELIANFIDFFDGLDAFLSQNPNAELQSLHRKLLDRLIIPNQIQYMPVISETFDQAKHVATDYFRSDKFPEKCVVFEVEKGYHQGDMIVKKSKVWVVQNLFECRGCGVLQSQGDARFCHLCGQKILAPNGLPVDSLPVFEPTPTTFLRFAERMIEKQDLVQAKKQLQDGLNLDPNFVPLLVRLADVFSMTSEFPDAISLLQRASLIKPDIKIAEKIKALEIRNTIYQQARSLNLPPEEFDKLINLIQK